MPSRATLICVALILLTAATLGRVCGNEFVNYDDDVYVTDNPYVRSGVSRAVHHLALALIGSRSFRRHCPIVTSVSG
ncbi:MAG TPA: hypothetical protein VH592_15650 [Gemmataceae bacterium]|jgi:hypothetical protein